MAACKDELFQEIEMKILCPICLKMYRNMAKQKDFVTKKERNRHISKRHGKYKLKEVKDSEKKR